MNKDNYKMVKIEEITFPSFIPKSESPTNDLITSIKSHGILQPIGICRNDQKVSEHKYLVIWGRKRLRTAQLLGIKEIPALIIDIEPSREEFLKHAIMESQTSVPMSRVDIWNAIKEVYLKHGDVKIVSETTGIPLSIVKDAVKSQLIDRLKGGRDLYTHVTKNLRLPVQIAHKVLEVVRKPDNVSIDKSKGEKLADVLATQDVQMRNKIIKAAQVNPLGDVDGWVEDAKELKIYKKELGGVLDIELLEEEDYGLLKMAEANGITVNVMIKKILRKKLIKEGFLEEE
tara:strand:+ start:1370 stop:2230 length:861 start_codon:yes stop_codon:yes gene_type:complete